MNKLLVIILMSVSCAHTPYVREPQSSFVETCKSVLSSILGKKPSQYLNPEIKESLKKEFSSWETYEYTRLMNSNDDYLAHFFIHSPRTFQEAYQLMPSERSTARDFFEEIVELIDEEKRNNHIIRSLNDTFMKRIFVERKASNIKDYIEMLRERYKYLSLARKDEIISEINEFWKYQKAIRYFEKNFYVNLHTIEENSKTYVKLRNQLIQYRIKNGDYHLKVPRDFVRIRGDNPLDTKKLLQMSQAIGLSAPKVYNGYLGLHGRFFLADGNHRFTARESRDFVWINIGPKLQTLNLEHHIIYSGGLRPKREVLLKLYNREVDVFEIMPEILKKDFPFQRSELYSAPLPNN